MGVLIGHRHLVDNIRVKVKGRIRATTKAKDVDLAWKHVKTTNIRFNKLSKKVEYRICFKITLTSHLLNLVNPISSFSLITGCEMLEWFVIDSHNYFTLSHQSFEIITCKKQQEITYERPGFDHDHNNRISPEISPTFKCTSETIFGLVTWVSS